ncbi:MAG: glyceraldehyde 3-phosphate dehydrogenase NAD-binding domain-containing protein, partial [Desulfobacterales bacterium]
METEKHSGLKLGINGFGRIGKLTLWHHVGRKYFSEVIVNVGRAVGTSLKDIAHYTERDSTYGLLHGFLYGQTAKSLISDMDEKTGTMNIDGVKV